MHEIQESGEMYLETILILSNELEYVRSVDVANHMGYSKPSVSRGMAILKSDGFIDIDKNGHITLTDSGRMVADKIYERHLVLTEFLVSIGVSNENASCDACKIEHVISEESFDALKSLILKLNDKKN